MTQNDLEKFWDKMVLNSCYGFPPMPIIPLIYDEQQRLKITKSGQQNLKKLLILI